MKRINYIFLVLISALTLSIFLFSTRSKTGSNVAGQNSGQESGNNSQIALSLEEEPNQSPDSNQTELLPDLRAIKLDYAYIEASENEKRILRFPGTFANSGDGPLELTPHPDENNEKIIAVQIIHKKDGTKTERIAGHFILHPNHQHWHFEDFVRFSIFSLNDDGSLDKELVSTGKITYCLHDYAPLEGDFSRKPKSAAYPWCTSTFGTQGISVGWVDLYQAEISGQELDITELESGMFAFRADVDPENRIAEKDEDNNTTITLLEIKPDAVRIVE